MTAVHLLPNNSTPLEQQVSLTLDRIPVLGGPIGLIHAVKYRRPFPPGFAMWTMVELGLGNISPYFETPEQAIDAGVPWQRVRGTPLALALALGWIDYDDIALEDQNARRRMWHRYQIAMGEVPAVERPRLHDAEYLAGLSDPARAIFFRGWHGYDVRSLEWSERRWSEALWGDDSGVRLDDGQVKWSHGEDDAGALTASPEFRAATGLDQLDGDPEWGEMPWDAPGLTWETITDPPAYKAFLLFGMPVYVGFYGADDDVIGYRRPVSVRDVTPDHDLDAGEIAVEIDCRTGFGDGAGAPCAACGLVFNARPADETRPGRLWLDAGEIAVTGDEADMTIGFAPLDFTFRATVRQHVTLTLVV